jgi:hypothetical protein
VRNMLLHLRCTHIFHWLALLPGQVRFHLASDSRHHDLVLLRLCAQWSLHCLHWILILIAPIGILMPTHLAKQQLPAAVEIAAIHFCVFYTDKECPLLNSHSQLGRT